MANSACKYVVAFGLGVATVFITGSAAAQNGASDAQYKIGIVDLKRVFDGYQRQIDVYAELDKEKNERQKKIDELSARIEKMRERYNAEKDKMSEEQKTQLEVTIETDLTQYQTDFKKFQQEIDLKEKRQVDQIMKDIRDAIEAVATKENYHIILEGGKSGSAAGPPSVLYSSTTLNMTQKIVDQLNAAYKK